MLDLKILGLPIINWKIYRIAKEFKPDLLIGGPGDCYITQVGWFLGIPGIIFDDTEFSSLQNKVTFPFAKQIITPQCFWLDLGKKHIRVDSYKELAYLHPDVFNPSKAVVRKAGIDPDKPFILLRLVSWQATHDVGKNEMSKLDELIPKLEKFGKVYISSERPLKDESRRIQLPAQDMHHVLAFARLLVGESATMASECAVLGTPAIYISNSQRGYTQEQQEKYDLVHYFTDEDEAIKDAITLLKERTFGLSGKKRKTKCLRIK